MVKSFIFGAAILGAALAGHPALAASAPLLATGCPDARLPALPAPHLARTLSRHLPAVIVALGSSSTFGWLASDPAHSYPAHLQRQLSDALPTASVAVLNRGVNGQDATEELPRLTQDVVALRPDLVIWQLGANAAMRHMDPERFRELALRGVETLQAAGIDVVLMDNQRAPNILAQPGHRDIEDTLAEIAGETRAPLFARGHLMDLWQDEGFAYTNFLAGDGVHHNDLGYACVANALGQSLVAGLRTEFARR